MRVLLSTIGSRGDVQPLVALAAALRELGHEARLCVPPDFRDWIESHGFSVTPLGPEVRRHAAAPRPPTPSSPEQIRQLIEGTVATQFQTLTSAARECDAMLGASALQIAGLSVAERLGLPYVFAAYCPQVLPSRHHAPPPLSPVQPPAPALDDYTELWDRDALRWNEQWRAPLNSHRRAAGLSPVDDVRSYLFTDRPWLAADPILAPWPGDTKVIQTGAWVLPDDRPLSPELERFLDGGEPPVYFGFGSMHASGDLGRVLLESSRAVGRRSIVSRGWAELTVGDAAPDCLVIGEANLKALFTRVAAVVHHGGAGTTSLAALAGAPQVLVPQIYDQHYWAQRVRQLGIGTAHAPGAPTAASLASALEHVLDTKTAVRARSVAGEMTTDGARTAAQRLIAEL